ncbi:MAG: xylR 1 [Phycisphaerales bacterium]|nr:xylR 1 [Phycisphaerales bacterium]
MNNYGRLIIRGIHRYANARREWLLHEELRPGTVDFKRWPRCDGAIFAGLTTVAFKALAKRTKHLVSCSSSTDPAAMPVVSADNYAIGRLAAEHLLDRRLKHFAFYGDRLGGRQRLAGFQSALQERGFTYSVWDGSNNLNDVSAHRHWPGLLTWVESLPKPVGFMAWDDNSASDLAAACLSAGIIVPDQVAIVSVNNDDIICESAWPPLSSVEVDFARVGYLAARQLDTLLHGGTIAAAERHLMVPPLAVCPRLSTDVQSVDDTALATAIAFIREHARSACSVGDVLKVVPVSRSWLERQFQEKLGRTPHEEIVRVRMEHARRLLMDTGEPIRRIAERCGFSAVQNFNRAFISHEGLSPAAFRRSHLLH